MLHGNRIMDARRDGPWWLLVAVAWCTGAWLRLWQLGSQILIDDEWHAIHKLRAAGYADIASHFGRADYSIPLTLYDRLLYQHGLLSEWPMHLPMVLAGIALLLAAPFVLRRYFALPVRATWTMLLAVSPVMVYLDRTARPYALTTVLAGLAVLAFRHWWLQDARVRSRAAVFVSATALAGWLHLLSLVFTLAPFVVAGAVCAWQLRRADSRRAGWHGLRRLCGLGALTALPLLVLLLPPLAGDFAAMRAKAGLGAMDAYHAWLTILMAFGTGSHVVGVLSCLLAALGGWRLLRRSGSTATYLYAVAAIGMLLVMTADPDWIQHPGVLMRYMVPLLPLLLLLLAEGMLAVLAWLRPVPLRAMAVLLAVTGLFRFGPLPAQLYDPNQFMGHVRFQFDYDPPRMLLATGMKLNRIPGFYRQLAALPPRSVTVVEAPWRPESNFIPLPWYQQLDRQYRRIGLVAGICAEREWGDWPESDRGMRLRQFVPLAAILRGEDVGADYLVLHMRPWSTLPPQILRWPDMRACLAKVQARLGAPLYRDDRIAAFAIGKTPQRVP